MASRICRPAQRALCFFGAKGAAHCESVLLLLASKTRVLLCGVGDEAGGGCSIERKEGRFDTRSALHGLVDSTAAGEVRCEKRASAHVTPELTSASLSLHGARCVRRQVEAVGRQA